MILGQYTTTTDAKKRTSLPRKIRSQLGDSLIITKGLESNLILVPESEWTMLLEGTDGKPFIQKEVREIQRFLLGNAHQVELDTKGRFIIPEYLRKYALLKEEIVFVGIGKFVEIWDNAHWTEYQQLLINNETIIQSAQKLTDTQS